MVQPDAPSESEQASTLSQPLVPAPERSGPAYAPASRMPRSALGWGGRSSQLDNGWLSPTVTVKEASTTAAVAPLPPWTAGEPSVAASPSIEDTNPAPQRAQSILSQLPIARAPYATTAASLAPSEDHTLLADLPITVASLSPPPPSAAAPPPSDLLASLPITFVPSFQVPSLNFLVKQQASPFQYKQKWEWIVRIKVYSSNHHALNAQQLSCALI